MGYRKKDIDPKGSLINPFRNLTLTKKHPRIWREIYISSYSSILFTSLSRNTITYHCHHHNKSIPCSRLPLGSMFSSSKLSLRPRLADTVILANGRQSKIRRLRSYCILPSFVVADVIYIWYYNVHYSVRLDYEFHDFSECMSAEW